MAQIQKRWTPSNWASWKPFGIGEQRPNNFAEVFRAMWENRDQAAYAWRILRDGVCDGCALGTSGLRDWTLEGVHLCNVRLRLLRLNTMAAFPVSMMMDAEKFESMSSAELRDLGRIPAPMIRRKGEPGFQPVGWDEAIELIADRAGSIRPERLAFYLTSRGMPNEAYYVAQKAARALGTNNVDNAARVCHSPSTVALKKTLGAGATTCSYSDWLESDLIVFFGSNVANNQPVATKYLHYAKKNGARVAMVNAYREPGMERYWIPSVPESALFGTKLADETFLINAGGDIAFINGVLKILAENEWIDRDFIENHCAGFDELQKRLDQQSFDELESVAGCGRDTMERFAWMIAESDRAVFVWSMGITQHTCGVDNVRAIINLALTKGFVGRTGCGLMPIRGHSGVQGGAEMGAYASVFPGGAPISASSASDLSRDYGFDVPEAPGLIAPAMIDAAAKHELDVLFSVGGNFLEVLPDPDRTRQALESVPLRVHMDIVLSPQMFVPPADTVLLLPAATRYETEGGVTETSTERRVIFSPEIPGPRIPEARPEWIVFRDLARKAKPDLSDAFAYDSTSDVRDEIARIISYYDGIQHLAKKGDQFQYGGPHLCADWHFDTADGNAHFSPLTPPMRDVPEGQFIVATRRGKQFNSMVHDSADSLTGAVRESVLMNGEDADALGLRDGDRVRLWNESGSYEGCARIAGVRPGNLQVHWPEGNVLMDPNCRDETAGVPDYNAVVALERIGS